jgi:WD40 repeat protein
MAERRIADRYEPVEELGRGGQATVVKAIDTRHGRLVALKVRAAPNGASAGLLHEARALLSLPSHPGLAHARDDLFDDGRHVLVLDWVDGVDLAHLLAAKGRPGLPLSSVLRWAAQAAEALSVLHRHGVVHGDVKPANLILERDGRVVLVDLGSSSQPDGSAPDAGTSGFRAPEVAGGAIPTPVSDVYSLAATVYALLTGAPPTGAVPVWSGIDADVAARLESGVRAGLAIDPARRPPTVGAFVEQLRAGWPDSTPTGVVTLLLAEVINATRVWQREPNNAPALFAGFDLTVDRCVEAHGGRRVPGTEAHGGGPVSAWFVNAVDAVRAAVDLQRRLRADGDQLHLRIGMATGEPAITQGQTRGPVVNLAAAVRELARAGEVLISQTTADIVRRGLPAGVDLLRLGPQRLVELDSTDDVSAVVADGVATPPDPMRSPYPGLAAFTTDHADLFVGREAVIDRCHELLVEHGFVAIVGASGSGKTSLALAGVVPRLGGAVVIRPGSDPLGALQRAELDAHAGHPLVVDQLEELVTLCRNEAERARFVEVLLAHPGGTVVTVRADLYGELAGHAVLAERLADSQVLLGPMDDEDLLRAIEEPARRCGLEVESGLAETVVHELGHAPGALPLLGHALRETWLRRDGRVLTVEAYRAAGGVDSAIASTADRALEALDDDRRLVARQLLLRMVELRRDGEDARRWATRDELIELEPALAPAVLTVLTDARLLVADGDQITVAHEALLRAWPKLRRWIAAERSDLLARQDLRVDAERWVAGGRIEPDLYRGARLDAALEVADRGNLARQDEAFVEAGRLLRDRERVEVRRRARRLRVLAAVATVLAVVAATVGVVALLQREDAQQARASAESSAMDAMGAAARADEQRAAAEEQAERANAEAERATEEAQRADAAARAARVQELAASAVSVLDEDPSLAKLLAVASASIADPGLETTAVLHRTWAADRVTARPAPTYDLPVRSIDVDPLGTRIALSGASPGNGAGKVVDVVDLATETTAWRFSVDEASEWVIEPRFTPVGGAHLAAGIFWDPYHENRVPPIGGRDVIEEPPVDRLGVHIWDAATGELVERYDVGRCGGFPTAISVTHVLVRTLHGSPDATTRCDWGDTAATIGAELVDRRTGERRLLSESSRTHRRGAAMSRDGTTVAYDDRNRDVVEVADIATGEVRLRLSPAPAEGYGVRAVNHDGSLLVYGDDPIEVWDVAAARRIATFDGHGGSGGFVTFVPNTETVLSTGADGELREWEARTGKEIRAHPRVPDGPVAATATGHVATIGYSGSNRTPPMLIDLGPRGELGSVETCAGDVASDALEVAGQVAVFPLTCDGAPSATTYVVDVSAQRVLYTLAGHQGAAVAVSPDRTRFVRQDGEGTRHGRLVVRDLHTGAEIVAFQGLCTWDPASEFPAAQQPECAAYPELPFAISARRLTWSRDGRMVAAVAGIDVGADSVVVWDAHTGALLHTEPPEQNGVADVHFSPNSALLAMTPDFKDSRIISTDTWEVVDTVMGGTDVFIVGYSADGSRVLVALQLMAHTGAELAWFDLASGRLALVRADLHEGSVRSVALSDDGELVATASTDGVVRVWDAPTLELIDEFRVADGSVEAVAFVGDQQLAIAPPGGDLVLVTTDADKLLELVSGSLTRGFTASECTRFGFGDECPTLAELRGPASNADDPAVLNGTYEISWTEQQFTTSFNNADAPRVGGTRAVEIDFPGTYTLTFNDGRFDIVRDKHVAFCTGSYDVVGDRVHLFAERREPLSGCLPGRFLEAGYTLTDDELRFDDVTAHPIDGVLFTDRPLERMAEG